VLILGAAGIALHWSPAGSICHAANERPMYTMSGRLARPLLSLAIAHTRSVGRGMPGPCSSSSCYPIKP
jgi:hypothetical protein